MHHFRIFIEITRLNKPIGFMLLFWPCSWGLAYANYFNQNLNQLIYFSILFFLGSVLMRSAGCIFNDIADRNFDKKVQRTKSRPITSGKISVKHSISYVLALCLLAFLILIQFNFFTIMLGISSMSLAFTYPFMKRYTYWPQLFLGITFNWGILMAWVALNNSISLEIIILYFSAIFWTLGYDTIYGAQDIVDDEIIGLKSTAIKFKKNIKEFILMCYLIFTSGILYLFKSHIELNLTTFFLTLFILSIFIQVKEFDISNNSKMLKLFKVNNISGLILFISFLTISFNYEI